MGEYTPGPWRITHGDFGGPEKCIVGPNHKGVNDAEYIAEVTGLYSEQETASNARLIAAAPDMYDEIQRLRSLVGKLAYHLEHAAQATEEPESIENMASALTGKPGDKKATEMVCKALHDEFVEAIRICRLERL